MTKQEAIAEAHGAGVPTCAMINAAGECEVAYSNMMFDYFRGRGYKAFYQVTPIFPETSANEVGYFDEEGG